MIRDTCSHAGSILKPHGTGGDLIIHLQNVEPDYIEPGQTLFVEINGTLIPYNITEISPKVDTAVVRLEFIDSISSARQLCGRKLFLHNDLYFKIRKTEKADDPSMFVGFSFLDLTSGTEGVISEYIGNESNPLFVVETHDKQFLVPAQARLLTSIDIEQRKIIANLPYGLTEI